MPRYYVVLTDWEEVLQKMVAWTVNEFVAVSFFKEYKKMDKRADIVVLDAPNTVYLSAKLKELYDANLDDIVNARLHTIMSKDNKCYAIYKDKYQGLFSMFLPDSKSDINVELPLRMCDVISRIMLNSATLVRYLSDEFQEEIINVLFLSYSYTSIKRMISNGSKSTPITSLIDGVYFWRLVTQIGDGAILSKVNVTIPADTVFIGG